MPEDTWFIGAEHNTCDELITLYDPGDLPAALASALAELRRVLDQACERSAHERCRRFASAPRDPAPTQALRHVVERSRDFSQARPELGHATNAAAALVGRRSMSQGTVSGSAGVPDFLRPDPGPQRDQLKASCWRWVRWCGHQPGVLLFHRQQRATGLWDQDAA